MSEYERFGLTRRELLRGAAVGAGAMLIPSLLPRIMAIAATQRDTLTIGLNRDPIGLNPIASSADVNGSLVMINNLYNAIVRVHPRTNAIIPDLAESWQQRDNRTWLFTFRRGVHFHKGFGELTADDAAFLFNSVIQGNKPLRFRFLGVEGARAVGRYSLEVKLAAPFSAFPTISAWRGGYVPSRKAYEIKGDSVYNTDPVGTGPFEFESWDPGSRVVLRRNRSYWKKGKPVLERVVFKTVRDSSVRTTQLKTGELDLILDPDPKDVGELRRTRGVRVVTAAGGNFDYIVFNQRRPPFERREVRQAVSYAVDRLALVQFVYFGEGRPDDVPIPPGFLGRPLKNRYPMAADQARARELLAKAGLPRGFEATAITSDSDKLRRMLQIVAAQMAEVGVNLRLQVVDLATYNARVRQGEFEVALEDINITAPDVDAALFAFLHSSGVNWPTGWKNAEADRLLENGRAESDSKKRDAIYREFFDIVLDEVPAVYLAHANVNYAMREGLANFIPTGNLAVLDNLEDVAWR